jgi:hypothetical protein
MFNLKKNSSFDHFKKKNYPPINLFLQEILIRLSKRQDLARACKMDE